jgi:hypothetical protein
LRSIGAVRDAHVVGDRGTSTEPPHGFGGIEMPNDTVDVRAPEAPMAQARETLVLARRLVVRAFLAGLGYSVLSVAGRGRCYGGIRADGGYLDRLGHATDAPPSCIVMTLHPSPVVYLILTVAVVWALSRSTRPGLGGAPAVRTLRRAARGVIVLALVAAGMAMAAFMSIPLDRWDGTGTPPIPGWLVVDVDTTPMNGS